jgi:hypothetical protein
VKRVNYSGGKLTPKKLAVALRECAIEMFDARTTRDAKSKASGRGYDEVFVSNVQSTDKIYAVLGLAGVPKEGGHEFSITEYDKQGRSVGFANIHVTPQLEIVTGGNGTLRNALDIIGSACAEAKAYS